jgi:DNA-binding GntR family transcriptional regulator
MGLIARQRGIGTTVLATTATPAFTQSVASLAELQQYAEETRLRSERIEHVVARGALAEKLRCAENKIWLRSEGWRIVEDREPPLCWTEVYIDDAFAAVEEDLRTPTGLIFGHLARRFGLALREVRQTVSAVAMPASFAPRLRVAPGSPALRIERRYFVHSPDPVQIAISIHPGDRFSYSMTLASKPQ